MSERRCFKNMRSASLLRCRNKDIGRKSLSVMGFETLGIGLITGSFHDDGNVWQCITVCRMFVIGSQSSSSYRLVTQAG